MKFSELKMTKVDDDVFFSLTPSHEGGHVVVAWDQRENVTGVRLVAIPIQRDGRTGARYKAYTQYGNSQVDPIVVPTKEQIEKATPEEKYRVAVRLAGGIAGTKVAGIDLMEIEDAAARVDIEVIKSFGFNDEDVERFIIEAIDVLKRHEVGFVRIRSEIEKEARYYINESPLMEGSRLLITKKRIRELLR